MTINTAAIQELRETTANLLDHCQLSPMGHPLVVAVVEFGSKLSEEEQQELASLLSRIEDIVGGAIYDVHSENYDLYCSHSILSAR